MRHLARGVERLARLLGLGPRLASGIDGSPWLQPLLRDAEYLGRSAGDLVAVEMVEDLRLHAGERRQHLHGAGEPRGLDGPAGAVEG